MLCTSMGSRAWPSCKHLVACWSEDVGPTPDMLRIPTVCAVARQTGHRAGQVSLNLCLPPIMHPLFVVVWQSRAAAAVRIAVALAHRHVHEAFDVPGSSSPVGLSYDTGMIFEPLLLSGVKSYGFFCFDGLYCHRQICCVLW